MIHHWKSLVLEIRDAEYHYDPTYTGEIMPSHTLNLKHVEIIKVSDEPTYDLSLESSRLGHHRFTDFQYQHYPTPSGEIIPSQTSNLKHVEIIKVLDKPTYDTSLESS